MIQKLLIENFKSIKKLQLDCKRVNLFIGEPNSGKSNLLEALSTFSLPINSKVTQLVRMSDMSNIFFDNDPSGIINLKADADSIQIVYDVGGSKVVFNFSGSSDFQIMLSEMGELLSGISSHDFLIHPYFFKSVNEFSNKRFDFLFPPNGNNLFSLLQSNRNLRLLISDFVQERGFKLTLRQATSEIEISKEVDNILTTYPYQVISDTLQRIIFYLSAIESNVKGTTLILEEPESNVFPYYTKYLAERIALESEKQFFITTHNPYFLQSLIEKTPTTDIFVNVVSMDDRYETKISTLSMSGVEEAMHLGSDIFLNLNKVLEA